jgi:hypothetical protein
LAGNGWGTQENGYGQYHVSNGAATGWGTQENGYGFYHESNAGSTGRAIASLSKSGVRDHYSKSGWSKSQNALEYTALQHSFFAGANRGELVARQRCPASRYAFDLIESRDRP